MKKPSPILKFQINEMTKIIAEMVKTIDENPTIAKQTLNTQTMAVYRKLKRGKTCETAKEN